MSRELPQLTKDQLIEWTENPVTIVFRRIAETMRDEAESAKGVDCFHPYEPQKTQEVLAGLNAVADTWDNVVKALSKEGIEEEFDELSQ